MAKTKKHLLVFEQDYDFEMIGICSHHNDYRLAWSINEQLGLSLVKSDEDYVVVNKKGAVVSEHSMYEFRDEENLTEFFLIKNKIFGKYLIPELPTIDFFLFLCENHTYNLKELTRELKKVNSILAVFEYDPEELDSTKNIVFN